MIFPQTGKQPVRGSYSFERAACSGHMLEEEPSGVSENTEDVVFFFAIFRHKNVKICLFFQE